MAALPHWTPCFERRGRIVSTGLSVRTSMVGVSDWGLKAAITMSAAHSANANGGCHPLEDSAAGKRQPQIPQPTGPPFSHVEPRHLAVPAGGYPVATTTACETTRWLTRALR